MKLTIKAIITALGILCLVPFYSNSHADAPTPGSASDPVLTKSYFDQNSLTQDQVKQLIASAIAKLPNGGYGTVSGSGSSTDTIVSPSPTALTIVQLKLGQTLYAGAGTEFIVRTGNTVAISSDEEGIPDVTSGKDIQPGATIENNHLLIFPKDTRGIKPAAKNTAEIYVMVRGNYLLLNADGSKVVTLVTP